VLTEGVTPSLHVDYKHTKIKQYHKEGRALRTETTINDSRDFNIGKRLCNLPALAQVGFSANRRLLDVEHLTTDPTIGEAAFRAVADPIVVGSQRASALPFDSARTQVLLTALFVFGLLPYGFRNSDLRAHLAPLLGLDPSLMTQGRMSYDLRRLRLHSPDRTDPRYPPLHRQRPRPADRDLPHRRPHPAHPSRPGPSPRRLRHRHRTPAPARPPRHRHQHRSPAPQADRVNLTHKDNIKNSSLLGR